MGKPGDGAKLLRNFAGSLLLHKFNVEKTNWTPELKTTFSGRLIF